MATVVEQLPGAKITLGPQPWQVLQREADGCAALALAGTWAGEEPSTVEVRVTREADGAPVAGCDWQDAEMLAENGWQLTLRVPTGGLYRIETRVRAHSMEWRNTGDKIWHVSVGDLWVIAGQSNAVGYGHGVVHDPPALGVVLFGGNEIWRMATHPIFDPTETKYPANRDTGWVDVSPWLAFGKEIWERTGVPIGLIPTALGGSPLSAWDPGNPEGAFLYDNMVKMIAAAGGRVAGMVWYQGCSDTGAEETTATYLLRFTRFVASFRASYGGHLPVITAQLNRYYFDPAGDPASERRWSLLREAQRQAAHTMPNLAVVPTLDLPLSDGIHTSAAGNVVLGRRFGLAALGMVYGQAGHWRAVDVQTARFANPERTAITIRFAEVVDHLIYLAFPPADMIVIDEEGEITLSAARVEGTDTVMLELARPAQGATVCHHQFGGNPVSFLRDHLQRPVLAFFGLRVEESA